MYEYISSKKGGISMKRILITVILTIICFCIGVTSFAVNDLSHLTTWYRAEVKPAIEKVHHDKKHDKKDKERESDKKSQESKLSGKKEDGKEENMNRSPMPIEMGPKEDMTSKESVSQV